MKNCSLIKYRSKISHFVFQFIIRKFIKNCIQYIHIVSCRLVIIAYIDIWFCICSGLLL